MMAVENTIAVVIVLLVPVALLYCWFFYWTRMRLGPPTWRSRATLVSLTLLSLVVLLWPAMALLMPRADWGSGLGVSHQAEWVEAWHRPILRTLLVALIVGLFGRPRLILPIGVACVGAAIFWVTSTMP